MSEAEATAAVPPKSAAQARYDRMRLQCNRFNAIRLGLDQALASIAASESARVAGETDGPQPGQMPNSFFAGLDLLLDANDQIAEGLENTVKRLSALF